MNAYQILDTFHKEEQINEGGLKDIIVSFRKGYLENCQYEEKIALHRNPIEVMNETLNSVYEELRKISVREEMRDIDGFTSGYVPVRIAEIWRSDRRIKTLYDAINSYCTIRNKSFNAIAPHVAEYRAMIKVTAKIKKDIELYNTKVTIPKRPRPAIGDMYVIKPENFVKSLEDYQKGVTHLAQISSEDFGIYPFETEPIPGFASKPNFPDCCENHRHLLKIATEKLNQFPDCCDQHKKLNKASWFHKENFGYMPLKFVKTLTYTWDCILRCIKHENWFKEITDYIEYTKASYGQLPNGYGPSVGLDLYLHNLKENLKVVTNIPEIKRKLLLDFVEKYYHSVEQIEQTDLNLLIGKYKEWLKIFPFDLDIFKDLKPHFESQMPILSGPSETNLYSGLTGFKLVSKKELIGFLVATTRSIIQKINSLNLYKEGLLSDPSGTKRQMVMERRRLEIEELDRSSWEDRKEYIKLLKKWLAGEKKFLSEISPLLKAESSNKDFIDNLIDGINVLQSTDVNADCIRRVRSSESGRETSFRYWFKDFLSGRYKEAVLSTEEEKGKGKIDLKITIPVVGRKIVEFKGWWNQDKKKLPEQICSYLSDFEKDGYIFMINHLETKSIVEEYRILITAPATNYISDSWREHTIKNTDYKYYESKHKFSVNEKTLYHFIFNAHFSNRIVR
jgi:hypothetical protein